MYGYSRQAYYKRRSRRKEKERVKQEVVEFVQEKRRRQTEEGAKKLYRKFRQESQTKIGRDQFIDVIRDVGLLVKRRRRWVKTTDSRHSFKTYPNLIKDKKIERVGQVVVADITYLETYEGFCFLSLLTDYYSRRIVGYAVSERLTVEGSLEALEMAVKNLPAGVKPIHHSDRGVQYCCHAYRNRLRKAGARISMTEEDHVYENALAERINGILKQELGLGRKLATIEQARKIVREAVEIYNGERLHMSLGYQTPNSVFRVSKSCLN